MTKRHVKKLENIAFLLSLIIWATESVLHRDPLVISDIYMTMAEINDWGIEI